MKQHLFFGFILIVCALGAFVILNEYIYQEKQEPNPLPVGEVTLTGVVTAVDTEQMMVDGPAVVSFISPGGEMPEEGVVPCSSDTHYLRVFERVLEADAKYEFTYRAAPAGYVTQGTEGMSVDPDFVSGFILMSEAGSKEIAATPDLPREYPPTIQGRVYKNTGKESAEDWASNHPLESNI